MKKIVLFISLGMILGLFYYFDIFSFTDPEESWSAISRLGFPGDISY